jgi:hypothetical protein
VKYRIVDSNIPYESPFDNRYNFLDSWEFVRSNTGWFFRGHPEETDAEGRVSGPEGVLVAQMRALISHWLRAATAFLLKLPRTISESLSNFRVSLASMARHIYRKKQVARVPRMIV